MGRLPGARIQTLDRPGDSSWGDRQILPRLPLFSALVAPLVKHARQPRWLIGFLQALLVAATSALLVVLSTRDRPSASLHAAAALLFVLGSIPVAYYTTQMFPETLAGALLLSTFVCRARGDLAAGLLGNALLVLGLDDSPRSGGHSRGDGGAGRPRLAETPLRQRRRARSRLAGVPAREPLGLGLLDAAEPEPRQPQQPGLSSGRNPPFFFGERRWNPFSQPGDVGLPRRRCREPLLPSETCRSRLGSAVLGDSRGRRLVSGRQGGNVSGGSVSGHPGVSARVSPDPSVVQRSDRVAAATGAAGLPARHPGLAISLLVASQPSFWFRRYHPLFGFAEIQRFYALLPPAQGPARLWLSLAWLGGFFLLVFLFRPKGGGAR